MRDCKYLMRTIALAFLLVVPILNATEQQVSGSAPAAAVDEEELFDESLKRFGYLAGLARGCVVETSRADFEREALDLHAAIGRLLGTDRAFLFSTSFGYGTSVEVETKDCAEVLKNYDERVEKFRAGRGGTQ